MIGVVTDPITQCHNRLLPITILPLNVFLKDHLLKWMLIYVQYIRLV